MPDDLRRSRALGFGVAMLVAFSVLARVSGLDRLPGMTGDESYHGAQALRLLSGEHLLMRTTSGNLVWTPHSLLLIAIHVAVPPGFAAIRLAALVSSLAQLVMAWALLAPYTSRSTRRWTLLLMATSPACIAYSRMSLESSDHGIAAILCTWAVLSRRRAAAVACFLVALAIHPTEVFLAPWMVALYALRAHPWPRRDVSLRALLRDTGVLVLGLLAPLCLLRVMATSAQEQMVSFHTLALRLGSAHLGWIFLRRLTELFSGEVIYAYTVGTGLGRWSAAASLLVAAAFFMGVAGCVATVRRERATARAAYEALAFAVAWAVSLLAFYVIAGPGALHPNEHRYGMVLLVPGLLTLAATIDAGFARVPARTATGLALVALGAASLASFDAHYLTPLATIGSTAHPSFWTGPREPKDAAFEVLRQEQRARLRLGRPPLRVVADSFFMAWPMAYLGHHIFEVRTDRWCPNPFACELLDAPNTAWVGFIPQAIHFAMPTVPPAIARAQDQRLGPRVRILRSVGGQPAVMVRLPLE